MRNFIARNRVIIGIASALALVLLIALFILFYKTGFETKDGRIQYIRNGRLCRSTWIEIEGDKYFADADGYIAVGYVQIGENFYYFDEKGKMMKGLYNTPGGDRFFGDDGKQYSGYKEVNSRAFYFGPDGLMMHDWIEVDGKLKFFGADGAAASGLVKSTDGHVYYALPEGGYKVGKEEVNGQEYIFGEDGAAQTGFVTDAEGNSYFICDDGYIAMGWFSFNDGSKGYAEKPGEPTLDTIIEKDGQKYYFNADGKCVIGSFFYSDGSKGYSDENGAIRTGYFKIDDAEYILDEEGVAHAGIIERNGSLYYTDASGLVVKDGYIEREGKHYYLGEDGVVQTGWIQLKNGTKGYALSDGSICYNSNALIDDVAYYFNDEGVFAGEGWVTIGEDGKGYCKGEGLLATGKFAVSSQTYYFDKTGALASGWIEEGDKKLFADENGLIVTGEKVIGYSKCVFGADGYLVSQTAIADKMVAITYDDGPSIYTPKILDACEKTGAHVTFFVVGNRIPSYTEHIVREKNLGCEIASHTYEHVYLTKLDTAGMRYQIDKTNEQVKALTGDTCHIIRPPGGYINADVCSTLSEYPFILWNIDTEDWKNRNTETTIARATASVTDGDIILMHDLYESTANAALTIMQDLQSKGFLLVTVSELAEAKGGMTGGTKYYCF